MRSLVLFLSGIAALSVAATQATATEIFLAATGVPGQETYGVVHKGNIYEVWGRGVGRGFTVSASHHPNLPGAKGPGDVRGAGEVLVWLSGQAGMRCPGNRTVQAVLFREATTKTAHVWTMDVMCPGTPITREHREAMK